MRVLEHEWSNADRMSDQREHTVCIIQPVCIQLASGIHSASTHYLLKIKSVFIALPKNIKRVSKHTQINFGP